MNDLTEQLNKGELPSDLYYIKDTNENIYIDECVNYDNKERDIFIFGGMAVKEVLAKVPNYKEFLALQSDSLAKNEAIEIIAELESENTKLKELLKTIKRQCELLLPKNGLAPVGDRERLCKTFFNLINEVLK